MLAESAPAFPLDSILAGGTTKIPLTRKEKLKEELKILEWHKMANEAAIKAAILQTKSTKVVPPAARHKEDDVKWIKSVIQHEHIKPLEVSKDFVLEYEKKEKENQERLTAQVERHISTLKNLRVKLENRNDLKNRSEEYRSWQRDFLPKKNAVMLGRTIEQAEKEEAARRSGSIRFDDEETDDFIREQLQDHASKLDKATLNKGGSSQELNTVLDSLNRLAELENRITSLEKDNKYDQMLSLEKPTANQRTTIEFRKTRVPIGLGKAGPTIGLKFQLKPTGKPPVSSGVAAVRAKQQQQRDQSGGEEEYDADLEGSHGPGVFITEGTDGDKREALRRERLRQMALASDGQKNMRNRVQMRKGRIREQQIGAKKHEEAMKELARRRKEQGKHGGGAGAGRGSQGAAAARLASIPPLKGISSGVRNKNKHLQEFESLKQSHKKRKEEMQKKLFSKDPSDSSSAAYAQRFASQTAPAYSNKNHPYHKISTQKEGTVTRRTNEKNAPIRRRQQNETHDSHPQAPLSAPPMIAVTAVSGVVKSLMQAEVAAEHGLTVPLFTPRTLRNITETISKSSLSHRKDGVRPEKSLFNIKLILVEKFNLLRSAIEVTQTSHSLSSNELMLILKLSDLLIDYSEFLTPHYLPYLRYGVLLREWLIMNMSIYDRMTENSRGQQGLSSAPFLGIEVSREGHTKVSLQEAIRLAKAHLKIWLREGLFADTYHLQRARELYDSNLRKQIQPPSSALKPAMSFRKVVPTSNSAEPTAKKEDMGFITNSKISSEDWLAYFRVLSLCGDHAAAAEVINRMLTLFDPAQEQALSVDTFSPQELQRKTNFFASLLFYAGCTYKALGQFERANDFFFEAIEAGPPASFTKIEMMMIVARNLEQMEDADIKSSRIEDSGDGPDNEKAFQLIHDHLVLECIVDESVTYEDWANTCSTWFALGDKCSIHHMYSLANDFYGIGIMKDSIAFQKSLTWFRFVKSCFRCGRLNDAQLALKQALRRDEHNQQLLRADKHLSRRVQHFQPDQVHMVITEANAEKLLIDWNENQEKSLFNLATFGNLSMIKSLLPQRIDMDKAAAGRVQAIVRGVCSRFHLMMGIGATKQALKRLHIIDSRSDLTLAVDEHTHMPIVRREIIKKMVAKVGVVLVVNESDLAMDPQNQSTKHFPFLLSCRPNWMGKISHIEAYDVRCDRHVRIKLQHPFLPIREKGIPRRLVLSLECKQFVSAELVKENIRSIGKKPFRLPDSEEASEVSAGTVTARTELLIKYTDMLTGEYMYRSMNLKFSFDHQKHNSEEILMCEEETRKSTVNLDIDDISQCTDFVIDVNDENLLKIRRELDTSSTVADADSVARSSDLGSYHSKKIDATAIEMSQKGEGAAKSGAIDRKAAQKIPSPQRNVIIASGASVLSNGPGETFSLAHVEEEVDYSSSVILTNIQQAVTYKSAFLWGKFYFFVTLVNENDTTILKLTETGSMFNLVFVMNREHFDRSADMIKLVKRLLQHALKNVLISSLFDRLENGSLITQELLNNLNSQSPRGIISTVGNKSHLVKYFDHQYAVVIGLFSSRNSPIIGNRFEIFDSSGHYLNTRRSQLQSKQLTIVRHLFAHRFLDADVNQFIKNGERSEIDTGLEDDDKHDTLDEEEIAQQQEREISDMAQPADHHLDPHDDSHEASHHRPIHKHHFTHRKLIDTGALHHKLPPNTAALQIYHTKKDKKHRRDSGVKFSPRNAHSPRTRRSFDHGQANDIEESLIPGISASIFHREAQTDDIILHNENSQSLDEDMSGLRPGGIMDEESTSVVNCTDTIVITDDIPALQAPSVPDLQTRISLDSSYICDPPLLAAHFGDDASACSNEEPGSPLDVSTADLSIPPEIPMRYRLSAEALQIISTFADKVSATTVQLALEAATQRQQEAEAVVVAVAVEVEVEVTEQENPLPMESQFEASSCGDTSAEKTTPTIVDSEVRNILEAIVLAVEYLTLSQSRQQKQNSSSNSVDIFIDDTASTLPSTTENIEAKMSEESEVQPPATDNRSPQHEFALDQVLSPTKVLSEVIILEEVKDENPAPSESEVEQILEDPHLPQIHALAVEYTNMILNDAKVSYRFKLFNADALESSIVKLLPDSKDSYESLDPSNRDVADEESLSVTSKENTGIEEISPTAERYRHSLFPLHGRPDFYDLNGDIYHRTSVGMLSTITSNSAESKVSSSLHSEEYKFVDTRNKLSDDVSSIRSASSFSVLSLPSALSGFSSQHQYYRDENSFAKHSVNYKKEKVTETKVTLPKSSSDVPYKVSKILSAGKKVLELKSFIPPENIWVSGIGTSKISRNYYPASEYSFDNANKLLQKLRTLSNQAATRRFNAKEGSLDQRNDSPPRPKTAPSRFEPQGPFKFGRDPIPTVVPALKAGKSKSAAEFLALSSASDDQLNEESFVDDFRFRVEDSFQSSSSLKRSSSPSSPKRDFETSPTSKRNQLSVSFEDSTFPAGNVKNVSPKATLTNTKKSVHISSTHSKNLHKKATSHSLSHSYSHSEILQGSLSEGILNGSKDMFLHDAIRGFSKVGYVENKPLDYTAYWKSNITRYLTSVGTLTALQKKLMAVNRLSPTKLTLEESICALADTDGNTGEIRIKAKELKFLSEIRLISSVLPIKDIVCGVIHKGDELFTMGVSSFTANRLFAAMNKPSTKEKLESDSESDNSMSTGSEGKDFASSKKTKVSKERSQDRLSSPKSVVLPTDAHDKGDPSLRQTATYQLHHNSIAVRKRAHVINLNRNAPHSISPAASLYFQRLQSHALQSHSSTRHSTSASDSASRAFKLPLTDLEDTSDFRDDGLDFAGDEETSQVKVPDFDGEHLDDYIGGLAEAYKEEEETWVPLVKSELVENTFKVMSDRPTIMEGSSSFLELRDLRNFKTSHLKGSKVPGTARSTRSSRSDESSVSRKSESEIQMHLLHPDMLRQSSRQMSSLSQSTTQSQFLPPSANNTLLPPNQLQILTGPSAAVKKSVRIGHRLTSIFDAQDSTSITVLSRRDALRAEQEMNLMKSNKFGAAARRRGAVATLESQNQP